MNRKNRIIHVGPCIAEALDRAIGNAHAGHVAPYNLLVGTERLYVDQYDTAALTDRDVVSHVLNYWGVATRRAA